MTTRASLQALALFAAPASFAANLYWDNNGGTANDWSALANWSTVVAGGTDPAAVPGSVDLAIFSASSVASGQTVNLNAARAVTGLSFTSSQAHALQGGGTNQILTLGASGIDLTGTGAQVIGSATAGQQVAIALSGNQLWTNSNNTGSLTVNNGVAPATAANTTLTLGGASTAANRINGVIANNGAGVTSITKTGTGTWYLGNTTAAPANTFTGAVTINGGTLRVERPNTVATYANLGAGVVAVNSGATLHFFTASSANVLTHTNNLTLSSGTIFYEDGNTTLSGTVGLTGSNTFRGRWDDKNLTLSGVVSGTGGITKINTTATGAVELILSGANTFTSAATGGVMTINGGYVRLANAGALGNTPTILANNTQAASTVGVRLAGGINIGAGRTLVLRNGPNLANDQRAALDNISGNNTWSGSIVLESPVAGVRNQTLSAASGTTLTINGTVYNSPTLPSGGLFVRGAGNGIINGNVFLGSGMFLKTDGGTWTVNSTGNTQGSTTVANGGVVINTTSALEPGKPLTLGEGNSNSGTLTINSGFSQNFATIDSAVGSNGAHNITGAGSLDTGLAGTIATIGNGTAADDLTLSIATVTGSGTLTKAGEGTLFVNGTTASAPVALSGGTLRGAGTFTGGLTIGTGTTLMPGNTTTAGSITASALALTNGTLAVNLGSGGNDVINVTSSGGLTQSGTTTVNVTPTGTISTASTFYPIISYTGSSPGTAGFSVGSLPPRVAGSITDNGSAIGLTATNDKVRWTGTNGAVWDINTTQNWRTVAGNTATNYLQGDELIFTDAGANTSITLGVAVTPASVDFQNTSGGPAYTLSGAGALTGSMPFAKTGTGTVTLSGSAAHSYSGATSIAAGTLEVNAATSNLTGTSGVDVAGGATLRLFAANADFGFNRVLSGSGTVEIDPLAGGTPLPRSLTLTGASPSFSGTLRLAPSGTLAANGSFRLSSVAPAALGTASIEVNPRAQLWHTGTIANNLILAGYGFQETSGGTAATAATGADGSSPTVPSGTYAGSSGIGAIRMNDGGGISGNILLADDAKIMPYGGTGTLSGTLTNATPADDLVVGGGASGANLVLTGNASALERIWVNGGGTTGTNTLVIGNNTTTGTLGSGDVVLYQDAAAAGLRMQRSDGYSLPAGQNIIAAHNGTATNLTKSFLHANTTGTGFTIGGGGANVIDLTDGTNGGVLQVGTNVTGAVLNLASGATVEARGLWVGDNVNNSSTVNQTGGSVAVNGINTDTSNNIRVGHYATETSTYNLSGGTLSFGSAAPATTPSATGELAGGIYVGVDGQGILNHSGGTVSTNFVVLDNRSNTASGVNMTTGIDQYNLSSAGLLELKSAYGVIGRNTSTLVNLNGGTVRITAADGSDVALNSDINSSGTTTLDTVNATRTFSLMNNITGNGTLSVTGGGAIRLNPDSNATRTGTSTGSGTQSISAILAGSSAVTKLGSGTTTLAAVNSYNGATTVSAGRLNIDGSILNSVVSVANGAGLGGEGSAGSITFGSLGGDATSLFADATTPGALTSTGTLTVNGTVNVNLAGAPAGAGAFTVLNHGGTVATAANFALANAANYRSSTFNVGANNVTLDVTKKSLVWDGSTTTWEIAGTDNDWNAGANDNFFTGDNVTFDETHIAGDQTVTMTGALLPGSVTVDNDTYKYTLTGSGFGGSGGLTKTGDVDLDLGGVNTFTGPVSISGGIVKLTTTGALGNGSAIAISGGGTLDLGSHTANTLNLGSKVVTISGTGVTGLGAITQSGANDQQNAFQFLTLAGNATISGSGRYDVRGASSVLDLGGFTLTKEGSNKVYATVDGTVTSGNVQVNGGTFAVWNGTVQGSGTITADFGGTVEISNTVIGKFTRQVTLNGGSLTSASAATTTGNVVLTDDSTFTNTADLFISGALSETGGPFDLVKTGAGALVLNGTNSLTGKVNVSTGILRVTGDALLGPVPGSPVADSITLQSGGRLQAGATTGVDMTLHSNRGVTLATGDGGFHVWTGFTMNYGGAITGPGNLTKSDGGTLVYSGTANHTGSTNFSAGTATLSGATLSSTANFLMTGGITNLNSGSLVTTAGSTTIGTATFNVAGGSLTTGRFVLDEGSNTSSTVNHTAGTVSITGTDNTNTNQASFLFGHWAGGNTATYNLSGGTLNSTGAELSFGWDSTNAVFNQTGGTANLLGLDLGNTRNNTAVYNLNGGRLNLGANGITTNGNKTVNLGAGTLGAFANWSSGQALAMAGAVTPTTVDTLDSVDGITARTITLSGLLSGNGGIVKAGAGTLTLNRTGAASNTYSGGTTVNAGTLKLFGNNDAASVVGSGTLTINAGAIVEANSHNALGQGAGAALTPVVINGGSFLADEYNHLNSATLTAGTIGIRSGVTQVDGIDMRTRNAVTPVLTSLAHASPSTVTSKLSLTNNTTVSVADGAATTDLQISGAIVGVGTLTKTGAGTLELTGVSTYTGATSVNAGTLRVNTGSLGNTAVTVATTGTLGGTGSIAGATTVQSGGTLAPGNSAGTLNFGSTVNLQAGSSYAVEITGAATHDKVAATGALTANGTIAVTLSGYTPVAGNTFDIVDAASITGTPTFNFTAAVLTAGLVWDTSAFATTGVISVVTDDPYTAWASFYGVTEGKNGDDDKDGESNLLEFATNSNPANGSSRPRAYGKMHVLGGDKALTYTVAVRKNAVFAAGAPDASKREAIKDKVEYTIEASNELGIWNSVVVTELAPVDAAAVQTAITPALPALDADWEWHTFRTDGGAPADVRDFIRLSVAEAP
ncbi:autotransporter-associated beta strand repeat-containing protein [Luteolibacter arcticus]|uniref:Autotransporter-associated beta strand repeat-containing protein n=1 Tax=Luteolibacter arcticus TaxID=1581411 RepID=A0ABT3GSD7_9BACT|nr:autotransporter-associated beta strand repeat-containing protein [Luteolibacter arcticus]MCW1926443.1 autotransporter-associated beta strand repeat-containing protein [Luteolibacter arcticus]